MTPEVYVKFVLALSLATLPLAARADGPRCDHAQLMRALSHHRGGAAFEVRHTPATRAEVRDRKTGEVVLEVTCDEIQAPIAERVIRPTRGPAETLNHGPLTLSRTSRGATSLDFAPGALHRDGLSFLLLDDQSFSLTRGDLVLSAQSTRPDGALVEVEGRGVGCGCERTTTPDGKVSTRPL
jgi:hypothetical protein